MLQFEIVRGTAKKPLASPGQTKKQLQCLKLLQLPAMTTEALSMVHNISSLTTTQQTQLHIPPLKIPLLNILAKNEKRIKTHRMAPQQQQWEEENSSCPRGCSPNGLTGSQDILLVTSYQLPRCSALGSSFSCVRLC